MQCRFNYFLSCLIVALGGLLAQPIAAQALNLVGLLPDSARPRLYAVNNKGKEANGSILVIDTLTKATIKEIPVGKEPTDMDLTENAEDLLVMNTTDRSISRINLTTLAVTTTYQLSEFSNRNDDGGGRVVDGPGNIIYYVDEQWGPRLRVYDTSTGSVLQTFGATSAGAGNDHGFGDIVVSPDKTKPFGWVRSGDGAGWVGTFIVRYDIAANGTLTFASTGRAHVSGMMREPFDSRALMTADGSRLVIKNRSVDPGNLEFQVNSSGLPGGLSEDSITLQSGGGSFSVPERFRIAPLNITKLVAHPVRPVVYGINTALEGEGFSHLLEIDAATATISRSIPIGFSPTDADLDTANDKLYISNWGYPTTRVIDLATWKELPALLLGTDVYALEVSSRGRIITRGFQPGSALGLWDSTSGENLSTQSTIRESDGEADSTGNFYYHCDNISSGATITKYNISSDTFVKAAQRLRIGYGSSNLILSGCGSKLFWQKSVFDSDLNKLSQMPAETFATNRSGDLSIGKSGVFWRDSGATISKLPFSSKISAISASDAYLVRFNTDEKTLHSTALSTFADLPGPFPRPGYVVDASPARLKWSPTSGATSYQVFIAADAAALARMSSPTASVTTNFYDLPSPLAFGRFYSWRVDAVTSGGLVTGKIQSFEIQFQNGPKLPTLANGVEITSVSLSDRYLLVGGSGKAQIYSFDHATGATMALQNFSLPGYFRHHYFGETVSMDAGKASIGAYAFKNPADEGGVAFVYRQEETDSWSGSGPLTLPSLIKGELFGRGLAASGNQMLVGTGDIYSKTSGRVAAYVTEPAEERIQVFSANDGVLGDGFGMVIAMEGNTAIISAPRGGSPLSPRPILYVFTRSTTTGLWSQTQRIPIEGAWLHDDSGKSLALSGNYFAVNNASLDIVEIYTKNISGLWASTFSIKQSLVADGSSYSFGRALAMAGDQLFVGDSTASYRENRGAVFSFRRSGSVWIPGPVITSRDSDNFSFGAALSVRDSWLVATAGDSKLAELFRIDGKANQTPQFVGNIPSQVVAGRGFTTEILADDADGKDGLVFDILQAPPWLSLTNTGDGTATLSGVPVGIVDSVQTVQLRVRDAAGAQALYTYRLTTLLATSLPVLTQEPSGGNVGEGQEVFLRAAVSGIGPFKWQWYRNEVPIPGATMSTLSFDEIELSDSGNYTVSVSNLVGQDGMALF